MRLTKIPILPRNVYLWRGSNPHATVISLQILSLTCTADFTTEIFVPLLGLEPRRYCYFALGSKASMSAFHHKGVYYRTSSKTQTCNLFVRSEVLFQLSYRGIFKVGKMRLELTLNISVILGPQPSR